MAEKTQVYAVIRIDNYESSDDTTTGNVNFEDLVTVKEILPSLDEAAQEASRLNQLNRGKGARYFWQKTRYFPNGRKTLA